MENETWVESVCKCDNTELRYKVIDQPGRQAYKQFKRQCLECGKVSNAISHTKLSDLERNTAGPVDMGISTEYWKAKQERAAARFENNRTDWFIQHSDYLRSPEWQAKRTAVFRRDGYICQGCLKNPAAQVHHVTYAHWQHEPLFDLVSVCVQYHDEITEMDRRRRTGAKDVS